MSTKLHHGHRIRLRTLADLTAFTERFRADARAWGEDALGRALARRAAYQFDRWTVLTRERPERDCALGQVHSEAVEEYRETRGDFAGRSPDWDWECTLCLLPDPAEPEQVYLLIFAEQDGYFDILRAVPGVEPYPYWDNTDPPEGVPQAAWRDRRATWDRAIGKTGVPSRRGLTLELIGPDLPLPVGEEVAPYLPDLGARARKLAKRVSVEGKVAAELGDRRDAPMSEYARIMMDYAGSDEQARDVARLEADFRARLKADLTVDDLTARGADSIAARLGEA